MKICLRTFVFFAFTFSLHSKLRPKKPSLTTSTRVQCLPKLSDQSSVEVQNDFFLIQTLAMLSLKLIEY